MSHHTRFLVKSLEFDDVMTETPAEMDARTIVEENRFLKAENGKLMAELEEATLSMLDTAHQQHETSDVWIRDKYTDLCAAIDAWALRATASFRKADFTRRFEELLSRAHDHRRDDRWSMPDALSGMPSDLSIDELSRSDNFVCFMLSLEIMGWLSAKIFAQTYPVGVTTEQQKVLGKIEEGMKSLNKDSSSIAQWRSDTIRGLVANQSFVAKKEKYAEEILVHGLDAVSVWLPTRNPFPDKGARFRRTFLDPALELHQAMCTSTTQYAPLTSAEPSLPKEPSQRVELRDLATWANLQGPGDIQASLGVLYPALSRLDARGRVEEVLSGAVLVVTLHETLLSGGRALQRRHSATNPHDGGKGEDSRHNPEANPGLRHSESEVSLPRGSHETSISVVKVGTEKIMVRRKTNDGRSLHKSGSGKNESPDRRSQRPKSFLWG